LNLKRFEIGFKNGFEKNGKKQKNKKLFPSHPAHAAQLPPFFPL
jgi:hypothetical protein